MEGYFFFLQLIMSGTHLPLGQHKAFALVKGCNKYFDLSTIMPTVRNKVLWVYCTNLKASIPMMTDGIFSTVNNKGALDILTYIVEFQETPLVLGQILTLGGSSGGPQPAEIESATFIESLHPEPVNNMKLTSDELTEGLPIDVISGHIVYLLIEFNFGYDDSDITTKVSFVSQGFVHGHLFQQEQAERMDRCVLIAVGHCIGWHQYQTSSLEGTYWNIVVTPTNSIHLPDEIEATQCLGGGDLFSHYTNIEQYIKRCSHENDVIITRYTKLMNKLYSLISTKRSYDKKEWLFYMTDGDVCTGYLVKPKFDKSHQPTASKKPKKK